MSGAERIHKTNKEKNYVKTFDVSIDFKEKSDEEIEETLKMLEKIHAKIAVIWIEDLVKIIRGQK